MRLNNFSLMGLSINMRQIFWNVCEGIYSLGYYQSGRHTLNVLNIVPSSENLDWIKKNNTGWTWIHSCFSHSLHWLLYDQPNNGMITSRVRQFSLSLGCFCILHSSCKYSKQQIHRTIMFKRIVPAV